MASFVGGKKPALLLSPALIELSHQNGPDLFEIALNVLVIKLPGDVMSYPRIAASSSPVPKRAAKNGAPDSSPFAKADAALSPVLSNAMVGRSFRCITMMPRVNSSLNPKGNSGNSCP